MEFLEISSIGTTYHYAAKIEQKFKQKKQDFGSMNQKQGKGAPKPQKKGISQGRQPKTTCQSCRQIKTP